MVWFTGAAGRRGHRWSTPFAPTVRWHPDDSGRALEPEYPLQLFDPDGRADEISIDDQDDLIRVNGAIVGIILDGLSGRKAIPLIELHGKTIRIVQWHHASRFEPAVVDALSRQPGPDLVLSLRGYRGSLEELGSLRPLAHRVETLLIDPFAPYPRTAMPTPPSGDQVLAVLGAFTRLRQLHLDGTVGTDGIRVLASMTRLHTLSVHPDWRPLSEESKRLLSGMASLRQVAIIAQDHSEGARDWMVQVASTAAIQSLQLRFEASKTGVTRDRLEVIERLGPLRELAVPLGGELNLQRLPELVSLSLAWGSDHLFGPEQPRPAKLRRLRLWGYQDAQGHGVSSITVARWERLQALEWLELEQAPLTASKHGRFPRLPRLTVVKLGDPVGAERLQQLADLPSLRQLDVVLPTESSCVAVGQARTLRALDLTLTRRMTRRCARSVAELTRLESLAIRRSDLADEDYSMVSRMTSLRSLIMPGARPGRKGLEHVVRAAALESLELDAAIDDPGAELLARLARLRSLVVDASRLTPSAARHLATLKHLRELTLKRPSHAGVLAALSSLPNLRVLTLIDAHLPAVELNSLTGAPSLRRLVLATSSQSATPAIPAAALDGLRRRMPGVCVSSVSF